MSVTQKPTFIGEHTYKTQSSTITRKIRFYVLNDTYFISLADFLQLRCASYSYNGITDDALISIERASEEYPTLKDWLTLTKSNLQHQLVTAYIKMTEQSKQILKVMNAEVNSTADPDILKPADDTFLQLDVDAIKVFVEKIRPSTKPEAKNEITDHPLIAKVKEIKGVIATDGVNILYFDTTTITPNSIESNSIAVEYVKKAYSGTICHETTYVLNKQFMTHAPLLIEKMLRTKNSVSASDLYINYQRPSNALSIDGNKFSILYDVLSKLIADEK